MCGPLASVTATLAPGPLRLRMGASLGSLQSKAVKGHPGRIQAELGGHRGPINQSKRSRPSEKNTNIQHPIGISILSCLSLCTSFGHMFLKMSCKADCALGRGLYRIQPSLLLPSTLSHQKLWKYISRVDLPRGEWDCNFFDQKLNKLGFVDRSQVVVSLM